MERQRHCIFKRLIRCNEPALLEALGISDDETRLASPVVLHCLAHGDAQRFSKRAVVRQHCCVMLRIERRINQSQRAGRDGNVLMTRLTWTIAAGIAAGGRRPKVKRQKPMPLGVIVDDSLPFRIKAKMRSRSRTSEV